jgi:hypothetical protein
MPIVLLGEQSVGKSYALNHLVDTSFAGSAMRTTGNFSHSWHPRCWYLIWMYCTEGVWMSVTPTDSALIVALDFEGPVVSWALLLCIRLIQLLIGVHSIERSAQEDALLVLFNTAISNLVCTSCIHLHSTYSRFCSRFFSGTILHCPVT